MGGASKILMLLSTPFPLLYPRPSAIRLARHSRISISSLATAAAAQGRLFPSNPRLRPGLLVRASEQVHTLTGSRDGHGEPSLGSMPVSRVSSSHPWPEWSKLVDHLVAKGYSDRLGILGGGDDDSFAVYEDLPQDFVKAAEVCLAFARDQPDLLRLLSKKNVETVVEMGSPFLFKNGGDSLRRMRLFLSGDGSTVLERERAQTVDIMRYVLSYAYNFLTTSGGSDPKSRELVEVSVRSLLAELVSVNGTVQEPKLTESIPTEPPLVHEQFSRPPGQNIEMKRGDWICPKCSFMNFARNMRCLECDEARPKRQLTGAEWECPQCDFFNYGRNLSCLRCDCKRPGETLPNVTFNRNTRVDQILSGNNTDKSELERRLAANDEKAERWFSKVSQLDDSSDLSSAIADEDFPEIMPLRKGVNRFVVSNRKTPLERRLANSQSGVSNGMGSDKSSESSISKSLDRILGRTTTPSDAGETNTRDDGRHDSSGYRQSIANRRGDPDHVPFVPLPPDMFGNSQKPNNGVQQSSDKEDPASRKSIETSDPVYRSSEKPAESKNDAETSDASERWFKKVAELDNEADLASAVPDEDFPEIMPMRKGENRFVVSKKKDRSLTSPQYKRRLAMEQANSSNFVPFVPFPPDYFAKKDKQPNAAPPNNEAAPESSASPGNFQGVPEKVEETEVGPSNRGSTDNASYQYKNQTSSQSYNSQFSGNSLNESKVASSKEWWNSGNPQMSSGPSDASSGPTGASATGSPSQKVENSKDSRESWQRGFSGKSLEGSAVKEPDPLDMSEEAKAERWFRRVAQIKDISELSQIPDEDFPEIMPMRKGVNRFVVSKRKTPAERRLTSPQYRRNLPIVSSEPEKDSN